MTYIFNNEDGYIKKCETKDCPNEILIGVSSKHCLRCLEQKDDDLEVKLIPYFEQKRVI